MRVQARSSGTTSVVVCRMMMILIATSMFACSSGSRSGSPSNQPVPGAADLEAVLATEGIAPLDAAVPDVSDELFELGQALFFDKILSGNMDVSCATCHWPEFAAGDDRVLPNGVGGTGLGKARHSGGMIPRNSPTSMHAHMTDELFWDGRVERLPGGAIRSPAGAALTPAMHAVFDSRWEVLAVQAMFPVTSREEMRGHVSENPIANLADSDLAGIWNALRDRVVAYTGYQNLLASAYPTTPINAIEFAHLANAMAAFQIRAFSCTDSPFERFVKGDDRALTALEVEGALEFFGSAQCSQCHTGSLFTDGDYHNIGLPQFGPGKGDGVGGNDDFGRERVTGDAQDRYRFRTPMLRNIELTAPYGHLGQFESLEALLVHYSDPSNSLLNYVVTDHVADPDVAALFLENRTEVLARLDARLQGGLQFDHDAMAAFLRSLTDPVGRDFASMIPTTVPSGLTVR